MDEVTEQRLGGGQTRGIVRIGGTVRRPLHGRSEFVHAVLRHLEQVRFEGTPRFLGSDEQGREMLTFIEGEVVAWSPDELSDARVRSAVEFVRRFHDAMADSGLTDGEEIVCHHDLGAHSTVFRGDTAVGLIDWNEHVAPGPRLFDLADTCWSFADVAGGKLSIAEQARRVALICDTYGWDDRHAVVNEIARRIRSALDDHARHGRTGAVAVFRRYDDWMGDHAHSLKASLE